MKIFPLGNINASILSFIKSKFRYNYGGMHEKT